MKYLHSSCVHCGRPVRKENNGFVHIWTHWTPGGTDGIYPVGKWCHFGDIWTSATAAPDPQPTLDLGDIA